MAPRKRLDINELNLMLDRAAATFWFSATARIAGDPSASTIEFDATTWRNGEALRHSASCPLNQIEKDPAKAARDFIESASALLQRGTRKP